MNTSEFDYHLPSEFIAQTPVEPRDSSRLLVLDRGSDTLKHVFFNQIRDFLSPGDVLVLNETKVIPARLVAHKIPTGGKIEILLLRRQDETTWEALVGGKGMIPGRNFEVEGGLHAQIMASAGGARRLIRFDDSLDTLLAKIGHVPLPPYIHTPLLDPKRYQTVFAHTEGSAAAPTAGLHFTSQLISDLCGSGIRFVYVTLHIGLDTFAPVTEESVEDHPIHTEWCQLSNESADVIRCAREEGKRIIAVGTTCVRTLESAARQTGFGGEVQPYEGPTNLFITPGYRFHVVDGMITNFHLPRSTLIMLVSAFAGRERILATYEVAKKEKYRFYSFGDAMLIL